MTSGAPPPVGFFLQVIPRLTGGKEDALYQNHLVLLQY